MKKLLKKIGIKIEKTHPIRSSVIKDIIKRIGHRFGYEISIDRGDDEPVYEYDEINTYATYSPWNTNTEFLNTYEKVKAYSLVDIYRCYELWTLVEQVSKLSEGCIIEVGTWRGGTGGLLAKSAKKSGINDQVFLCDTFKGVVKAGAEDSVYRGGEHENTSRELVEDLVQNKLELDNVEILEGIFPDDTGHQVEDLKFRLCHIDVDVYNSSKDSVDWIWDRLVPNGIVVYDDYGYHECNGITKHVEEQMDMEDRIVLYNLNGHAIVMKIKN